MSDPTFSVVIPAFNASRTIEMTVRSVLAQSRPDLELIVVDDESTDDTPERVASLARDDPRVTLIRQRNQGTAGARNTGIERASGRYVSLLDNDDLWLPNYLDSMGRTLEADPGAGFAYTDAWLLDDRAGRIRLLTSLQHYDPVPPDLSASELLLRVVETNFIMSSVTIRREVLAEVGGFDAKLRGADDWDLWLRILARGYRAALAPGCVLIQRDHPTSQSKDEAMMLLSERAVLTGFLDRDDLSDAARERARAKLEAGTRRLALVERRTGLFGIARAAVNRLRELKRSLLPSREWRREPPAEIARAFPDIARDYGRPATRDS